jgi:hypothetical protein
VRRRRASLEGVRAKIRRAESLRDELLAELKTFLGGDPYATEVVDSPTTPDMLDIVATRVDPVPAVVPLRITPRSTTNGHTISFGGRVLGGYIAHGGLPLEIEYREGRRWMTYRE